MQDIQWLRGEDGVGPASEAVSVLARVLAPLLAAEGLELFEPESPGLGVDLVASAPDVNDGFKATLAIEYKHHGQGRPLGIDAIRQLIGNLGPTPYKRAMLIGRFGFTEAAQATAHRLEPVSDELLDLNGIEAWGRRVETGKPANTSKVELLIRSISHEFAVLVASNPRILDDLEWRDLERMMARVMEGLGFRTTLTPSSKDGGKDLILVCNVTNGEESYIVELKHWRCGNRVGKQSVKDFMHVIITEKRAGGLFLSTSGYAADAFEGIAEVHRQRLRLGGESKVALLAQTYLRACNGLWSPPSTLPQVLCVGTS